MPDTTETNRRRTVAVLIAALVALAIGLAGLVMLPSAEAAPRTFRNCAAVHKVYPHGIAKSRAAANRAHVAAKVSASLYRANAKMDRDHDGVSCEKR